MTKEEQKGNLKIGVKDFGPISSGSVDLKPLTVLIGPNNSGKSYFAMLVNSIFKAVALIKGQTIMAYPNLNWMENIDFKAIWEEFPDVESNIKGMEVREEFDIPKTFIERIVHIILDKIFEKQLHRELTRSFTCHVRKLVRNNKRVFTLEFRSRLSGIKLDWRKNNLKIKEYPELDVKMKIRIRIKDSPSFLVGSDCGEHPNSKTIEYGLDIGKDRIKDDTDDDLIVHFIGFAVNYLNDYLLRSYTSPFYYLPAARSGILTGHKALVSNIVRKASYVGIEEFDIPIFPGAVSDLMSSLIELTDEEGPLFGFTREFEHELIGGEVVISTISDYMAPDIKYRFKDKEISMHQSSSTVKELAPLFLYLKYKVAPGTLLIIEEPEAHLHPENQRILAKLLVRLIRKGVKLFITTHSDYLLDQLSSFIMLSRTKSKKQREELNYDKDDYLKPDEIGVHVFQFDKKSKGYKIEEVEISAEDGISQEEFLKVNEALYEESIKIREKIEERKG